MSKSRGLGWKWTIGLAGIWLSLSAAFLADAYANGKSVTFEGPALIALILVPVALAKSSGLTGKESIKLTNQSIMGPKGFIKDIVDSVDKNKAD